MFISMTPDDLLTRTAQYQIHYSSSSSRNVADSASTSHEDPPSFPSRASIYPRAHAAHSSDNDPGPTAAGREYYDSWSTLYGTGNPPTNDFVDLESEAETNSFIQNHPSATSHLPSPPPFTVITDCDDKSGDEEEESSAAILADRYRRDHMAASYSSDDEDGGPSRLVNRHHRRMGPPGSRLRRSQRLATPSRIEPSIHSDAYHMRNGGSALASGTLAPHARFFIERERSMVSMRFDPPV